jgi:hypothetical protein
MKTITLTKGQVALVDDEDFEELNQFRWHVRWERGVRSYYVQRKIRLPNGKQAAEHMHRRILGLQSGDKRHGDHINHDTLDNRRANLRIAPTFSDSIANRRKHRDNQSGFKNVYWHKYRRKFAALVCRNGKQRYVGYFNTAIEAHEAAVAAGRQLHGEFYCCG